MTPHSIMPIIFFLTFLLFKTILVVKAGISQGETKITKNHAEANNTKSTSSNNGMDSKGKLIKFLLSLSISSPI